MEHTCTRHKASEPVNKQSNEPFINWDGRSQIMTTITIYRVVTFIAELTQTLWKFQASA